MSDRNTPWRNGDIVAVPVAAATMIYGGHMVGQCCRSGRSGFGRGGAGNPGRV
jgi:hypothetical protein